MSEERTLKTRRRYFVVLDIDQADEADKHDMADWISMALSDGYAEPNVYASLEDLLADRADKAGSFEDAPLTHDQLHPMHPTAE